MNNVSIFSFFSGSGLLDLGFEDAGLETVFVNEYHKPFLDAYKYSRNNIGHKEPKYGYSDTDINDYVPKKCQKFFIDAIKKEHSLKRIVGFIGGPPCPDFSVGGKNRGKHGDNGRLSEVYIDLTCSLKPDFILFENVKGLWRTKRHREFYEEIKIKLHNSGYTTTEKLVNSIEYAVPQDRERILLFGIRKTLLLNKKMINQFNWDLSKIYNKEDIFSLKWPTTNTFKKKT
ncbi:MAG: DNA cytosine methyltransferase [Syntrophorhabdaceae bacterium]